MIWRCRWRSYSSSCRSTAVWSFGDNSSGALGLTDAALVDSYEATKLTSLPVPYISSVSAGHYHSLAVAHDGRLWAWGRNNEAQLGRGGGSSSHSTRDTWSKPERVVGLDHVNVRAAFASGVVSAAVADDGSLWVWGRSKRGQLGLGNGIIEAITPSRVVALSGHEIVKVSFGWGHSLALTKDGKVFGWGYSKDRRLGELDQALDAPTMKPPNADGNLWKSSLLEIAEKLVAQKLEEEKNMPIIWEPCIIEELSNVEVSDIACGLDHTLILCGNGTLLSCGDNTYGQLGREKGGSGLLPVDIDYQPITLSAGLGHSLAICQMPSSEDGEGTGLVSWGWNQSFQLGHHGPGKIPAMVEGLEGETLVSASAGRVHSIALNSKGQVWAWGSGRNGRLGLGSSTDEMEPALVESLDGLEVLQAVSGFDHNLLLIAE
ncbi:putative E3 ubiquitin-protein ligase HERC3 isoform X1 [Iris pallida]|uniref:E3 ubiquitin-protein ligase HERC3 isoform X1 n=1 Tax=Iris pallida TaxID=29817 RepID=A0AAX6DUM7_IRIPA|nr:putative E3 ubiquitin-protein ligase HERC3 isoform X1 [Iris pallida]